MCGPGARRDDVGKGQDLLDETDARQHWRLEERLDRDGLERRVRNVGELAEHRNELRGVAADICAREIHAYGDTPEL